MFLKRYSSEIEIKATRDHVWSILTDNEKYYQWNTFTTSVDLNWEIGSKVKMKVNMKPGQKPINQTEYLCIYEAPNQIAWRMNWGFMLKAIRTQELVETQDEKVKYITIDTISGMLTPLVHLLYGKHIQNGFDRVAHELKTYAEGAH